MPEDAVRRWTAAYIAHAKEKHAEGWLQCSVCLSLREGVVHSIFIVMLPCRGASVLVPILPLAWLARARTHGVRHDAERRDV
jgi:hypothetical protein